MPGVKSTRLPLNNIPKTLEVIFRAVPHFYQAYTGVATIPPPLH